MRRSSLSPPYPAAAISDYTVSPGGRGALKIAVMGAAGVGKSAMIYQYIYKSFVKGYWSTVRERYLTDIQVDGKKVSLDILDTPGTYCLSGVRQDAIRNADGFMLVYSVGDESSFEKLAQLRHLIVEQKPAGIPVLIVGNKTDLEFPPRYMSREKAQWIVEGYWKHTYFEASTTNNAKICEIFHQTVFQVQAFTETPRRRRLSAPIVAAFRAVERKFRRKTTAS